MNSLVNFLKNEHRDLTVGFCLFSKEFALSVSRAAYHNHMELKSLLEKYEAIKKRFTSDKTNMVSHGWFGDVFGWKLKICCH